jgi:hypothetical protein
VGERNEAGDAITRRIRAHIGREPSPDLEERGSEPDVDWPPEDLLALHERYDVSNLNVEVPRRGVGWFLTPLRRGMLRPVEDLAARQSLFNALTARVLSELGNRTAQLYASEAARRTQENEIQTLRRRVRALEHAVQEVLNATGRRTHG